MSAAMVQVTECPDDIKLVTRVATINDDKLTLGNSVECDLILTTEQSIEDSVWATISPLNDKGEYLLQPHTDDILVNARPVVNASEKPLADGDIVQLENYTLLFSCEQAPKLSHEESDNTDGDVKFDANNILAGLGDKPTETRTTFSDNESPSFLEYDEMIMGNSQENLVGTSVDELSDKIDHLLENITKSVDSTKKLLSMLDGVVDEFIKEFDPALIEDMVGTPNFFNAGKHLGSLQKILRTKA